MAPATMCSGSIPAGAESQEPGREGTRELRLAEAMLEEARASYGLSPTSGPPP